MSQPLFYLAMAELSQKAKLRINNSKNEVKKNQK
jgi:hypothetical protein